MTDAYNPNVYDMLYGYHNVKAAQAATFDGDSNFSFNQFSVPNLETIVDFRAFLCDTPPCTSANQYEQGSIYPRA